MTREEKKAAKLEAREAAKQDKADRRAWDKTIAFLKKKGALIEETQFNNQ